MRAFLKIDLTSIWPWAEITRENGKTLEEWCQEQKVGKASSVEQIVKECDCIVVLSPDNPERHEDLSDLSLKSGKPVYIDKPIAPTLKEARRLFEKVEKYKTPMMSSSALRFDSELKKQLKKLVINRYVLSQHAAAAISQFTQFINWRCW